MPIAITVRRLSLVLAMVLAVCTAHASDPAELIATGDRQYENGEFAAALATFEKLVEIDPENRAAHYRVAKAAIETGSRERGLRALDAMLRIDPALQDDKELRELRAGLEALTSTAPVQPTPVPSAAAAPRSPDLVLAVRSAERVLSRAADGDKERRQAAGREAIALLRPHLLDPLQDDIQLWRIAGLASVFSEDHNLRTMAFEAIQRLRPNYNTDESLLDVMVELNFVGLEEQVRKFSSQRAKAVRLATALEQGDLDSSAMLASMYASGIGVTQDDAEAFRLYRIAAEAGSSEAAIFIAMALATGTGVQQDSDAVIEWLSRAKLNGSFNTLSSKISVMITDSAQDSAYDLQQDSRHRVWLLTHISMYKSNLGDAVSAEKLVRDAITIANATTDQTNMPWAYADIAEALVIFGRPDEAMDIAIGVRRADARSAAIGAVIEAKAGMGDIGGAFSVLDRHGDKMMKGDWGQSAIVDAMVKNGAFAEAERFAMSLEKSLLHFPRYDALKRILVGIAASEGKEAAEKAADRYIANLADVEDDERHSAISEIAVAMARIGSIQKSINFAEQLKPEDGKISFFGPSPREAYMEIAIAFSRDNNETKSNEFLEKANKFGSISDKDLVRVYGEIAEAFGMHGNEAKAQAYLVKSYECMRNLSPWDRIRSFRDFTRHQAKSSHLADALATAFGQPGSSVRTSGLLGVLDGIADIEEAQRSAN